MLVNIYDFFYRSAKILNLRLIWKLRGKGGGSPGPSNLYQANYKIVATGYHTGVFGFLIQLFKPDGTVNKTQYTFSMVRIFLVPAITIIPSGKQAGPDLRDYESLKQHL